ncbi:DUF4164 family protein [Streptomyces plumbiresistens]
MIPLLRENGVRFVQLARNGHLQADGFTILDDSRHPEQLIARGPWTLWDDQESVGTVPQVAGTRKCSLWAKGDVGDWWLKQVGDNQRLREEVERLRGAVRRSLGQQLDQFGAADLGTRIDELTTENQQLRTELDQARAQASQLESKLQEAEDDLAAARAGLRRMIRLESQR